MSYLKYNGISSVFFYALLVVAISSFFGCTTAPKEPTTFTIASKTTAPDSLKAKASFATVNANGSSEKLSGVMFGVPHKRYRLELSGTMGVGVASLLWNQGQWTLIFPTEEQYLQGNGDRITVPGTVLNDINVHLLAGLFWGELLPFAKEDAIIKDQGNVLEWEPRIGMLYRAHLGANGWVNSVEAIEEGKATIKIEYGKPTFTDGRWLPETAQFARSGTVFLKVTLKNIDEKASWGAGVWKLPVPSNYRRWSP